MNDEFLDSRFSEEEYEFSKEGCICSNVLHRLDCECQIHCI